MRAQHDKIGIPVHRRFYEPMGWVAVVHFVLGLEPCFLQAGCGFPGELFMLFVHPGRAGGVGFPQSRSHQPGVPLWVDVGNAEHLDAGSVKDCPTTNGGRRRCGALGAVLAKQDAANGISPSDEHRSVAMIDDLRGDRAQDGRLERVSWLSPLWGGGVAAWVRGKLAPGTDIATYVAPPDAR